MTTRTKDKITYRISTKLDGKLPNVLSGYNEPFHQPPSIFEEKGACNKRNGNMSAWTKEVGGSLIVVLFVCVCCLCKRSFCVTIVVDLDDIT